MDGDGGREGGEATYGGESAVAPISDTQRGCVLLLEGEEAGRLILGNRLLPPTNHHCLSFTVLPLVRTSLLCH